MVGIMLQQTCLWHFLFGIAYCCNNEAGPCQVYVLNDSTVQFGVRSDGLNL